MTLPSAAACTGSPAAPSISMPLVLALKLWMILPGAGQAQLTTAASLARAVAVGCTGSTGVTGIGVAVPVPEPAGARSEERRVGKEWVRTGRSWWSPEH